MKKINLKVIVGVVALPFLSTICSAGYRYKPSEIAQTGDLKSEVEIKCGAPMSKSYEGGIDIDGKMVYVDMWTYNPGKGNFIGYLNFMMAR